MEKQQPIPPQRVLLEIKTSRTGEETPEAMGQFLASLLNLKKKAYGFFTVGIPTTLEIAVLDQRIHWYVSVPTAYQTFIESQIIAQYPKVLISKGKDFLGEIAVTQETLAMGQLKLTHAYIYPLRTYTDFTVVDPMTSIVSALSKMR